MNSEPGMNRESVAAWVTAYERVWRTPGTDELAEIFTADASYLMGPYLEAVVGEPAIARLWEAERDGPHEAFEMASEVVAVDGDTAVVRVEVEYHDPPQEYRDLWILRFAADGRCRAFEEWPFSPPRS